MAGTVCTLLRGRLGLGCQTTKNGMPVLHVPRMLLPRRAGSHSTGRSLNRRLIIASWPILRGCWSGPPGLGMFRQHISSQTELVEYLEKNGYLTDKRAADAMARVDRRLFVPSKEDPYEDRPVPLGWEVTISAPHMHAAALNLLANHLVPGASVLDGGSGSGYLSAVMAEMVVPGGKVTGIEYVEPLLRKSRKAIEHSSPHLLSAHAITLLSGNALDPALLASHGPFDAIHVGAAATGGKPPKVLVDALKAGGRLVVPVGSVDAPDADGQRQVLWVVDKDADGSVNGRKAMFVRFVPLVPL